MDMHALIHYSTLGGGRGGLGYTGTLLVYAYIYSYI